MTRSSWAPCACAAALLALHAPLAPVARAAPPTKLTIAIFAPSLPFADSSARMGMLRELAHAIEARTGIATGFESFARYGDLIRSRADLAILDAPCVVTHGGQVLATASVGRDTATMWALFAREPFTGGPAGKRLAYLETGCRDDDFLDNALLGGAARASALFSARVAKGSSVQGVITSVQHYRDADVVFAPVNQAGGLTRVFDAVRVPHPGLVVLHPLDAAVLQQVQAAVLAHAGAIIDGWRPPAGYVELAARMAPHRKHFLFAVPDRPRVDADALEPGDGGLRRAPLRLLPWLPPMPGAARPAPARPRP